MYHILLQSHSLIRYFLLLSLIAAIVLALCKWLTGRSYGRLDNKLGLYLVIFAHLQVVVGIILYFLSPAVQFGAETMKNDTLRYWTLEHVVMMLAGVAIITVVRVRTKKLTQDNQKHRLLFLGNLIAMAIILASIMASGRGIVGPLS